MRQTKGFTLMEVMIALLISAISLLGLAALQGVARKNIDMSFQYTQASLLMEDLAERMRANPIGVRAGFYNGIDTTAVSGTGADCSAGCNPANIANNDILAWSAALKNSELLLQGSGKTQLIGERILITVMWNGKIQRYNTLPTTCPPLDCMSFEVDSQ